MEVEVAEVALVLVVVDLVAPVGETKADAVVVVVVADDVFSLFSEKPAAAALAAATKVDRLVVETSEEYIGDT